MRQRKAKTNFFRETRGTRSAQDHLPKADPTKPQIFQVIDKEGWVRFVEAFSAGEALAKTARAEA